MKPGKLNKKIVETVFAFCFNKVSILQLEATNQEEDANFDFSQV